MIQLQNSKMRACIFMCNIWLLSASHCGDVAGFDKLCGKCYGQPIYGCEYDLTLEMCQQRCEFDECAWFDYQEDVTSCCQSFDDTPFDYQLKNNLCDTYYRKEPLRKQFSFRNPLSKTGGAIVVIVAIALVIFAVWGYKHTHSSNLSNKGYKSRKSAKEVEEKQEDVAIEMPEFQS